MAKGDNIPVLDETVVTATIEDELNDANKFKINGADYYCYFEISTSEFPQDQVDPDKQDPTNTIRLTKSAIVNLDLQENFFEPFCAGHITVNNPYDYKTHVLQTYLYKSFFARSAKQILHQQKVANKDYIAKQLYNKLFTPRSTNRLFGYFFGKFGGGFLEVFETI